jgi:tRNA(Ile)-lysidine synthetase-like protein
MKTFVVAVSGGVDSVVLLHKLVQDGSARLVVAHFDHGIRPDSAEDASFVAGLAELYGLPFESSRAELGASASEDTARQARYAFLQNIRKKHQADAIITAHHQDDLIETAAINTLRGTHRKGLVSLRSSPNLQRPLLNTSKSEIYAYAVKHRLEWREDNTNRSDRYLRNRIRFKINKSLDSARKKALVGHLGKVKQHDNQISEIVNETLANSEYSLKKTLITELPEDASKEFISGWLRKNNVPFDKKAVNRINKGVRFLQTGAEIDVSGNYYVKLTKTELELHKRQTGR